MNIDWLAITPQSGKAGTNPISFQLISENDSFEDKAIRVRAVCGNARSEKTIVLKGKSYPIGTVFNFAYTGSVQEITLPKGRYKLQCWGAQGGNVSGSYTATGSKGGYSEGILTLTEPTTIYVFVGGQGTSSSTSSSSGTANGGWNGGGGSVRKSSYDNSDIYGESYPRPGGGATDMCLVTSTMNYSSGRTNRSSASLLSRFIVAGGGAGASARYTEETEETQVIKWVALKSQNVNFTDPGYTSDPENIKAKAVLSVTLEAGETYRKSNNYATSSNIYTFSWYNSSGANLGAQSDFTPSASGNYTVMLFTRDESDIGTTVTISVTKKTIETETSTTTSDGKSNSSQQGGGTSGRGSYPGAQNYPGNGGAFGLGANQATTGYRYAAGAGGGGWYGGGTGQSDTSTSYINFSGGGSGFVNTAANAGYRPSGYTGLQLESGSTKDGSTSFPSTSGGNETGHSGNGYARITVLE